MSLNQDVDSIIAEAGITDATLANEEPTTTTDDTTTVEDTTTEETTVTTTTEDDTTEEAEDTTEKVETDETTEETTEEKPEDKTETETVTQPDNSASETVQEAKTFLQNLNVSPDQVFNEDGTVKPFEDIVPAGKYLASQLEPVKVTDKDGKTHEFLLLSEVEEAFPDGFEAKNNIEQMKFQNAILGNEKKFEEAVKTYNSAKTQYTQETNAIVQAQSDNTRLRSEYESMANAGLVPKIEGSPDDPKFLESAAVKELDKILTYMETQNKELKSKGLGQITSLYVAKQLMDVGTTKTQNDDKKSKVIADRKEVASLTSSPTPDKGDKKQSYSDVPLSRLAESIIAEEGLR